LAFLEIFRSQTPKFDNGLLVYQIETDNHASNFIQNKLQPISTEKYKERDSEINHASGNSTQSCKSVTDLREPEGGGSSQKTQHPLFIR
jgi:hypothetical protein